MKLESLEDEAPEPEPNLDRWVIRMLAILMTTLVVYLAYDILNSRTPRRLAWVAGWPQPVIEWTVIVAASVAVIGCLVRLLWRKPGYASILGSFLCLLFLQLPRWQQPLMFYLGALFLAVFVILDVWLARRDGFRTG